jgi:polyhydroxybutyrate depolymerase
MAIAALAMLACAGSARGQQPRTAPLGQGTLEFGGRRRSFVFYAPQGEGPFPLLVALHGRFGDGRGQDRLSGLSSVAAREGFIAVFPDGYRRSWSDARGEGPAAAAGVDDVGFLSALIDEFIAHHRADPGRVYAAGMSNGAMMALTLACRIPGKLAGVAAVAGLLPAREVCAPPLPVSVVVFAGDEDPVVPYRGGKVGRGGSRVFSARETLEELRRADGCVAPEPERVLKDAEPADGTRTLVTGWTACAGGAEVRLYTVEGGGHTWPGGWQYLGERIIGKTARDFSASEELWRLLAQHRR